MIGPVRSVGSSAVTQVSSSAEAAGSDGLDLESEREEGFRAVEGGLALDESLRAAALRFLEDFLSPLKERGLTGIAVAVEDG